LKKSLAVEGVTKLDGVFLTHNHSDHIGGLKELLKLLPVDVLYGPYITGNDKSGKNPIDTITKDQGMTVKRPKAGDSLELSPGGAVLDVVGPVVFNPESENDNSLVMYLTDQKHIFLFAGDMQFSEERTLLDQNILIRCDMLKVGDHGNNDATSSEFINKVSPSIAVISTNNTYQKKYCQR
jgi:competence protein ComEC